MRTHRVAAASPEIERLRQAIQARRELVREGMKAGIDAASKQMLEGGIQMTDVIRLTDVARVNAPKLRVEKSLEDGFEKAVAFLEHAGMVVPKVDHQDKLPFGRIRTGGPILLEAPAEVKARWLTKWARRQDRLLEKASHRLLCYDEPGEFSEKLSKAGQLRGWIAGGLFLGCLTAGYGVANDHLGAQATQLLAGVFLGLLAGGWVFAGSSEFAESRANQTKAALADLGPIGADFVKKKEDHW